MAQDGLNFAPYIRVVHDFTTKPDFSFGPVWINDHALHYFKEGSGVYQIGVERHEIEPGVLLLVRPGINFSIKALPQTSLHMLNIHFDFMQSADSATLSWPYPSNSEKRIFGAYEILTDDPASSEYLPTHLKIASPSEYEWLFANVKSRSSLGDISSMLETRSAMLKLLAHLYWIRQTQSGSENIRKHEREMKLAMDYIEKHYPLPIRLCDIADSAGLSESHFSSLFRAFYSVSPLKFVTRLRIEKAKFDLCMTEKPIKEIAYSVGYDSVHHFTRVFKQSTSSSPARFRDGNFVSPNDDES